MYALHLGYQVDPADLGEARRSFRDGLLATIIECSRGMASMGYRVNHLWQRIARSNAPYLNVPA